MLSRKLQSVKRYVPIQATGGTISQYTQGGVTWKCHTFTGNGTFSVTSLGDANPAWIEYLVVGGGGGARGLNSGSYNSDTAGGGGGGVVTGFYVVEATSYPVVVGNGGVGTSGSVAPTNGQPSSIATIAEAPGGESNSSLGSITPLLPYGEVFTFQTGGVGGAQRGSSGAGGKGAIVSVGWQGGAGGIGYASSISGSTEYYAGGGAGGSRHTSTYSPTTTLGGLGGGGSSPATRGAGTNGAPNTGGGAGGSTSSDAAARGSEAFTGASGGSGIVIIRYPISGEYVHPAGQFAISAQQRNDQVEYSGDSTGTERTMWWTVPPGVTSVSILCVGAGGQNSQSTHTRASGAGGGALAYSNNISVTPLSKLYLCAGTGFLYNGTTYVGTGRINDSFVSTTSSPSQALVLAKGGGTGTTGAQASGCIGQAKYSGGTGTTTTPTNNQGGGGGGAAGYAGNGGNANYNAPAGGGGGGGYGPGGQYIGMGGGSGGGVGIYGQGASGTAGTDGSRNGVAGSNGSYQQYGGGASGSMGGAGAVRIIWGAGRAFPSTNTGDV